MLSFIDIVRSGNVESVERDVKNGADIELQVGGDTPLMLAARCGYKDCVEFLLRAGALVDTQNARGDTALIFAAAQGNNECVEMLLRERASVDIRNSEGRTALMKAADCMKTEMVKILLCGGANIHLVDKQGKTASTITGDEEIRDIIRNSQGRFTKSAV